MNVFIIPPSLAPCKSRQYARWPNHMQSQRLLTNLLIGGGIPPLLSDLTLVVMHCSIPVERRATSNKQA